VSTRRSDPEHEFVLLIDGPIDDDDVIEALYLAGCGDATFGMVDGVGEGDFTREAPTFLAAIAIAIRDVESVAKLRVVRVESQDLLTMADIARRLGRTRESVRLLVEGKRGKGGFPKPHSGSGRWRFWRWSDVAGWIGDLPVEEVDRSRTIAAVNAALELRRQRAELGSAERALIDSLAS
jgi:hypothetical protein